MPKCSIRAFVCAICAAISSLISPAPADSFTIQDWDLGVQVYHNADDYAADGSEIVVNPLIASYQVTLPSNPATSAAAQYDISWLVNYGSFNIFAQLAAQDGDSVRSLASGTIYFHTDVDLTLNLSAQLNYNLTGYGQTAQLYFAAADSDTHRSFYDDSDWYSTFIAPTGTGALTLNAPVAIPANRNCLVQYNLRLETFGYSSTIADAVGEVHFTLTPEPATLTLLAAGGLLCRPRRRSRLTAPCRRTPIA